VFDGQAFSTQLQGRVDRLSGKMDKKYNTIDNDLDDLREEILKLNKTVRNILLNTKNS
jgi:hypothetical protein